MSISIRSWFVPMQCHNYGAAKKSVIAIVMIILLAGGALRGQENETITTALDTLANKPQPLFNPAKAIVQPIIGAAFVIPWIVYLSTGSDGDRYFRGYTDLSLYLATPLAMSLTMSSVGWIMDSGEYSFPAGFGLSCGLSYLGAGVGYLFSAIIASGGDISDFRAYYIASTCVAGFFSMLGAFGGDFLGKLLTRNRVPLQSAFVSGHGDELSFGIPVPFVSMARVDQQRWENYIGLSLVSYRFN